ncbi:MAG: hypothetical protein C0432_02205 [Candidatus Puniceispirillum sp.]|nr:hypothetical protein [Candidatus Pelagibacter sp.]MBA4283088.1 hypothetical protein [Candidatus Puniceispirillum sp.]
MKIRDKIFVLWFLTMNAFTNDICDEGWTVIGKEQPPIKEVMFVTNHKLTESQLPHPIVRNLPNPEGGRSIDGVQMRRQLTPESLLDFKNGKETKNTYKNPFQDRTYHEKDIHVLFDRLDEYHQKMNPIAWIQELKNNVYLLDYRHFIGITCFSLIGYFGYLSII